MFNIYIFIGSFVYIIMGFVFHAITANYIKELTDKVAMVNYRFVEKMRFTIVAETKMKKDILVVCCYALWPIICIAAIIKAEYWHSLVVKQGVKKVV